MDTQQLLYLQDPTVLKFEANVLQVQALPQGETGLVLDRSYFYPTGGGQEFDNGRIDDALVLRVYKEADDRHLIHVVDRPVPLGRVSAVIDAERRLRHMQNHTAQHLLTQCFLQLYDLDTLSAHINGYAASSLDLPFTDLSPQDLERVETLANQIIYENRAVKSYFVTAQELERLPLRRKPSVSENIRIVEIDSLDYTPCGGTHCQSTGSIGVMKIIRTEHPNKNSLRISFAAGIYALEYFREVHAITTALAGSFGIPLSEVPAAVQRQADQLKDSQLTIQALQAQLLPVEAEKLAAAGEAIESLRAVVASFEGRPAQDMRALAGELKKMSRLAAVLWAFDGQKLAVIAACGPGSGASARDLLPRLLAPFGGRGGGDASLAQGGGPASREAALAFPEQARAVLREVLTAAGMD